MQHFSLFLGSRIPAVATAAAAAQISLIHSAVSHHDQIISISIARLLDDVLLLDITIRSRRGEYSPMLRC